ncbi:Nucleotidyltransferase domain protein [Candidatus Magnetomorum sp. HK-1]|nr:Nucleotidyltransferase domain protein [Candidatus Magnetomorum sp. HK-1]
MINIKQIKNIADVITQKFNTTKIFLFGSHAYGTPQNNSDIDICIITHLGNKRKIELTREIRKEFYTYFKIPIDLLIYDNKEFKERSINPTTLEYKILKQGILINE